MKAKNLVLAFSPLIVFTLSGRLLGAPMIGWAALVSAGLALVILVAGLRDGIKLVTAVSMIVFGALAALALLGGSGGAGIVAQFGSGICALLLGLAMLVSTVTVPFTVSYARASVPREHWESPTFKAVNARLSLVWAGVVIGIGLSRLAYGGLIVATGEQAGPVLRLGLGWGVPIALVLVGLRSTKRLTGDGRSDAQDRRPPVGTLPLDPS